MVVLVVVLVVAVAVVAVVVYHRVFGSDSRSIEGHHTIMERLGRMHGPDGSSRDYDPDAVAGVRVMERVAPRAVSTDDTLVKPPDLFSAGERAMETASIGTAAATGSRGQRDAAAAYDDGTWGPPVQPLSWGPPAQPGGGGSARPAPGDGVGTPGIDSPRLYFEDDAPLRFVDEPTPSDPLTAASPARHFRSRRHRLSRAITLVAFSLAVIAVVVVAAVTFSSGGTSPHHASTAQPRLGGQSVTSPHGSVTTPATSPATAAPRTTPTTRRPTTTTAPPPTAPAGDTPALRAISPASGVAGQQVTLTGWNLFSSNGLIIVRFGSAETGVACPVRSACTVTVPSLPYSHPTPVAVTLTTDRATTNAVVFIYR